MDQALAIETARGQDPALRCWLPDFARLRIMVFREFPYLYDGDLVYEEKYLSTYTDCPDSIAVRVCDGVHVVGASTGLPLTAESEEFQQPFLRAGIAVEQVFYCGESLLLPDYRGRGLYQRFFAAREDHARRLRGIRTMALCGVVRPPTHPRRPPDYQPLDSVWEKFGYRRRPDLVTQYAWQDLDEAAPSPKEMLFWLKRL
jgi:GNAT superfamily N-acetyltransferase